MVVFSSTCIRTNTFHSCRLHSKDSVFSWYYVVLNSLNTELKVPSFHPHCNRGFFFSVITQLYLKKLNRRFCPSERTLSCQWVLSPVSSGTYRVSYRGVGALEFSPPEILKLSMVVIVVHSYLISHVTGRTREYVSSKCCLESLSQIVSEAIWEDLNSKFSRGVCPQTSLVAAHTYACYYHPATVLFSPPPTQNPVWNPDVQYSVHTILKAMPPLPPQDGKSYVRPWIRAEIGLCSGTKTGCQSWEIL